MRIPGEAPACGDPAMLAHRRGSALAGFPPAARARNPAARLGFGPGQSHNRPMEIKSDNPEHGFQFPGEFEITALGPAGSGLEEQIPALLEAAGLVVLRETVATRESSGGKFVSVKLAFRAESREQYDVAHAVLREHPEVKWTL
jgi:putative lipoic acid-binding regulatory protein